MIRIGAVVLNVSDVPAAAKFWVQALGYRPGANPDFLIPSGGGAPQLHLDDQDTTHLDLWVDSEQEQRSEVERLVACGAHLVDWDYPDNADFVVLADPSGNFFCIINTAAS